MCYVDSVLSKSVSSANEDERLSVWRRSLARQMTLTGDKIHNFFAGLQLVEIKHTRRCYYNTYHNAKSTKKVRFSC